jgi:hypothetical protein
LLTGFSIFNSTYEPLNGRSYNTQYNSITTGNLLQAGNGNGKRTRHSRLVVRSCIMEECLLHHCSRGHQSTREILCWMNQKLTASMCLLISEWIYALLCVRIKRKLLRRFHWISRICWELKTPMPSVMIMIPTRINGVIKNFPVLCR